MTPEKLKTTLDEHAKWLKNKEEGSRANLRSANLEDANLYGANLRSANLEDANLRSANLEDANLRSANLEDANLYGANLRSANLYGANLEGANLRSANLEDANLYGANLRSANLYGANLEGANLYGANLRSANLEDANLYGANLPYFQIPDGDLVGWKKLNGGVIAELRIPYRARRTATLVGRKCRCEMAEVVALHDHGVDTLDHVAPCGTSITYTVGGTVYPDSYDDDIRIECTHGIHFFATRKEAENYW